MKKPKVKKLIEGTRKARKLRPDNIRYIIELANEHPKWSVKRIFDEALRPRIRSVLMLPITPKMRKALTKAAGTYQISMADVCCHVLEEWLKAKKMY